MGDVAKIFSDVGVCVVQQCAKLRQQGTHIASFTMSSATAERGDIKGFYVKC